MELAMDWQTREHRLKSTLEAGKIEVNPQIGIGMICVHFHDLVAGVVVILFDANHQELKLKGRSKKLQRAVKTGWTPQRPTEIWRVIN